MEENQVISPEKSIKNDTDDAGELNVLTRWLMDSQEEERIWVSRQLHDVLGQSFTVLKLMLDALKHADAGNIKEITDDAISIVDEATDRVRIVSRRMRPGILDLSLKQALGWLFKHSGIKITFRCSGLKDNLPSDFNIAVYRIVQEAIDNIARHSGAGYAGVNISVKGGFLKLRVSDNGRGFEVATVSSGGLLYMRQRAAMAGGSLQIFSSPGEGTVILASFPLPEAVTPRVVC